MDSFFAKIAASFMAGLVEMAKCDVGEVLWVLYCKRENGELFDPNGNLLVPYEELATLGRRLAAGAALVAGEEKA